MKPARIALAWVTSSPGVTSTLMSVSRTSQVLDYAGALDLVLLPEHRAALDASSKPDPHMLYTLVTPALRRRAVFCEKHVLGWSGYTR